MVYVTGNLQQGIYKINDILRSEDISFCTGDKLIVLGDFRYLYIPLLYKQDNVFQQQLDYIEYIFPGEILLLPGVNERYDVLNSYNKVQKYGGNVIKIAKNVFAMRNNECYIIEGNSYWTMGGGFKPGIFLNDSGRMNQLLAMPSNDDIMSTYHRFESNNHVDYILTHTAPRTIALVADSIIFPEEEQLLHVLDHVFESNKYLHWYFGRYGKDKDYTSRITGCWDKIYLVNG